MSQLSPSFPKLAHYRTAQELVERFVQLGRQIPCDPAILRAADGSPMAQPIELFGRRPGNRWCVQPMEGWDGTLDGKPTAWTHRRWRNFGRSGAKLIWGGEAAAVRHDGRANPNQLMIVPGTQAELARLREDLVEAHRREVGPTDDLVIGLQLTHSGRFSRPNEPGRPEPRIAYHHPVLDARLGIAPDDDSVVLTDDDLQRLMDEFVAAARLAAACGFDFVDVKCCHGYLGHELLGAFIRAGRFGGCFENRTRFLRGVIGRIQQEVPALQVGVRLSAFDLVPFEDDPATRSGGSKGIGVPVAWRHLLPYRYGFGVNSQDPTDYQLDEPLRLLLLLREWGVRAVNITGGSPYYCPHVQRPAFYPPCDGYRPPEDPLAGVARQIEVTRALKCQVPGLVLVGSGYTYLQEWLPCVAQAVVRAGWVDFVGLGRMVLSYPRLPWDSLCTGDLQLKHICRTFSDCTNGPRRGLISGCYPLDPTYRFSDAGRRLRGLKAPSP